MPFLETVGKFKAKPISKWIHIAKTGSTGVGIQFFITHYYNPEKRDWFDCEAKNMTLEHVFYIYKADNSPIQFQIDALKKAFGWSGKVIDFDEANEWNLPACQIETEFNEYNGKTRLRVKWLNPLGGKVGHQSRVSSRAELEELQRRIDMGAGAAQPAPPPEPGSDDIPF